jgi:hypothetical protein
VGEALLHKVKWGIARLIDAYQDGLLDKAEFEPRLRGAKERLAQLEAEAHRQEDKRRAIIRALVKRVEVAREEVRVVYRISPSPVVDSSNGGCFGKRSGNPPLDLWTRRN